MVGQLSIQKNFTEEAIIEELLNRRTNIIFNAVDSPYTSNPSSTTKSIVLDPFFRIGTMLQGFYSHSHGMYSFTHNSKGEPVFCEDYQLDIDWRGIFILIGWLAVCFLLCELCRQMLVALFHKYIAPRWNKRSGKQLKYYHLPAVMDEHQAFQEDITTYQNFKDKHIRIN